MIYEYRKIYDVTLQSTPLILDHIPKWKKWRWMESLHNMASIWFSVQIIRSKVSSFTIQKFFCYFSLSFDFSVDVVVTFLSCSSSLLKSWSCLLKCLQDIMALGFFISFLWLLSLMLNGVWFTTMLNFADIAF